MVATNPVASTSHSIYGNILYWARRFDDAVARLRRAIELDAGDLRGYIFLARIYEATGKPLEALKVLDRPEFANSQTLGHAYAVAGRRADALRIVQLLSRSANPDRRGMAHIYFALGDKDRGLEWLAKSLDAHETTAPFVVNPAYDSVRSDPRFQALVARLKFPPAS